MVTVERRFHPRYPLTICVTIRICADSFSPDLTLTTLNISQTGIQLCCDHQQMAMLLVQPARPVMCIISCYLPEQTEEFVSKCRLLFNRRISNDYYHLVFRFVEINGKSEQLLTQALRLCADSMIPPI